MLLSTMFLALHSNKQLLLPSPKDPLHLGIYVIQDHQTSMSNIFRLSLPPLVFFFCFPFSFFAYCIFYPFFQFIFQNHIIHIQSSANTFFRNNLRCNQETGTSHCHLCLIYILYLDHYIITLNLPGIVYTISHLYLTISSSLGTF